MTNSDLISMIAMAEFAALVSIVLGLLIFFVFRRRSRDTAAATDLVKKVKETEQVRRGEIEKLLTAQGLSGAELGETVKRLMKVERQFYEEFIRTYLTRDSEGVKEMDVKLKAVIAPYAELRKGGGAPAAPAAPEAAGSPAAGGADPAASGDVERLKATVRNLSEEISIYRETLNRVFSEYTAMFGVNLDPKQQLTAKEIMERLNSGDLAGPGAAPAESETAG